MPNKIFNISPPLNSSMHKTSDNVDAEKQKIIDKVFLNIAKKYNQKLNSKAKPDITNPLSKESIPEISNGNKRKLETDPAASPSPKQLKTSNYADNLSEDSQQAPHSSDFVFEQAGQNLGSQSDKQATVPSKNNTLSPHHIKKARWL